ncbi:hypothetical protein [Reyranella sp.]|uniref:hypothetical protein n=1 Tax=Reyranella sp. TaxID=1929291 RepID=UPI003D0E5C91
MIVNDDAIVSLAAVSASQDEGHAGATVFVFAPTLLGDLPQAIAANIDPVYIGAPAFEMHGVRPVAASRKSRWRPACTFCCARNIGRNGCPAVTTSKGQGFATDFRDPTLRRH